MGWVTDHFYETLIGKLGLAVTSNRMNSLKYHQYAEGPKRGEGGAKHNPLNVIKKMPGSTDFNDNGGFPVQNYVSMEQGVEATAAVLRQDNYASVLKCLRDNASPYYYAVAVDRAGQWTPGWLFCQVLHDHGIGAKG